MVGSAGAHLGCWRSATDIGPGPFMADSASSTCTKTGASLTGSVFVVRANGTVSPV